MKLPRNVLLYVATFDNPTVVAQAGQVSKNVTTNELANWHRYKYLKGGPNNTFENPFDKGCRKNCTDTCFPERSSPAPLVLVGDQQETMSLLKMEQGQLANSNNGSNPS